MKINNINELQNRLRRLNSDIRELYEFKHYETEKFLKLGNTMCQLIDCEIDSMLTYG